MFATSARNRKTLMANDHRPDSLISLLMALAKFTLLVCGIAGLGVRIFHEQGWIKQLFDTVANGAFATSLAGIIISIIAIVLGVRWYDSVFSKAENANALGNFLMRAMMVAGAYFLYLYITTGSFKG